MGIDRDFDRLRDDMSNDETQVMEQARETAKRVLCEASGLSYSPGMKSPNVPREQAARAMTILTTALAMLAFVTGAELEQTVNALKMLSKGIYLRKRNDGGGDA